MVDSVDVYAQGNFAVDEVKDGHYGEQLEDEPFERGVGWGQEGLADASGTAVDGHFAVAALPYDDGGGVEEVHDADFGVDDHEFAAFGADGQLTSTGHDRVTDVSRDNCMFHKITLSEKNVPR